MPKKLQKPRIIALTGGIGSGKSAAAQLFSALGVPVIDADLIAREMTKPDTKITQQIKKYFGPEYFIKNKLNRKKLGKKIFNSEPDRKYLENLLHPEIYKIIKKQIKLLKNYTYIIIVIPLLIETGVPDFIDKIIVVDAPKTLQLKRIIERDAMSPTMAKKIMATQASRKARLSYANEVILNNKNLSHLKSQIEALHQKYSL